ncbi:MAG: molybdenum cofactor biosynthesis protein MoaE [Gemmatimonadaceae bacterium]
MTVRTELVRAPIDTTAILKELASPGSGAVAMFVGTVRDSTGGRGVTGIEYSAYDAMAEREIIAIVTEAISAHQSPHIVVEHRLGTLAVGEASIAIGVAHERRAAAIGAMQYIIEEFKRRVPIWKMEHYEDGSRDWVDPTRRSSE